ncbi:MAG: hypothetical protein IID44_12020 [Planctomycetes bacterium]|nr:hypothetical protein [Planctomycetota bacterium]
MATLAFDRLARSNGGVFEEIFKKVAGFEDDTLARARQVLRLAALLHDVGHGAVFPCGGTCHSQECRP